MTAPRIREIPDRVQYRLLAIGQRFSWTELDWADRIFYAKVTSTYARGDRDGDLRPILATTLVIPAPADWRAK